MAILEEMFNLAEEKANENLCRELEEVEQELINEIKNAAEEGRFEIFYPFNIHRYLSLSYSRINTFTFELYVENWLKQQKLIHKNVLKRNAEGKWKYYGIWVCWDKSFYKHTNEYYLPEDFKVTKYGIVHYWKQIHSEM